MVLMSMSRQFRGRWPDQAPSRLPQPVQFDDGRWCDVGKCLVKGRNAWPVCFLSDTRACMTSRNRCLHGIRSKSTTKLFCAAKCGKAATDEKLVPGGAVLLEEQHRLS